VVRACLRDFDRLSAAMVAAATDQIEAPLRRSVCWRLMRPIYALEQHLRRRRRQLPAMP
jgi:hypothetical protein